MSYITGWIIVGIITFGIYKLFELFVGKKERLALIEKLGDKAESFIAGNKFYLPTAVPPVSFSALKLGSLLLGMGLGLLVGYIICMSTVPDYFTTHTWFTDDLALLIYGASTLFFGGLALIVAFMVELKISRKEHSK